MVEKSSNATSSSADSSPSIKTDMDAYDLVEWLVLSKKDVHIFIDEFGIHGKSQVHYDKALKTITNIFSASPSMDRYVWLSCKRIGFGMSGRDNKKLETLVQQLRNEKGVCVPSLQVNLRSSSVITKFVQKAPSIDDFHPHPADPCSPQSSSSDVTPVCIHAPDAHIDTAILRKAFDAGMIQLNIDPFSDDSTEVLVILTDSADTGICAFEALDGNKSDSRVCSYFPDSDACTNFYKGCNTIEESLEKVNTKGGILITERQSFSGAEATNVVVICHDQAYMRDYSLRTISRLLIINTYHTDLYHNEFVKAGCTNGGVYN